MSEAPERDSKTEEATPQKLEKAREKGDVPKTMDLAQFATLAIKALTSQPNLDRYLTELNSLLIQPDIDALSKGATCAVAAVTRVRRSSASSSTQIRADPADATKTLTSAELAQH